MNEQPAIVTIARRLYPVESIALIEPFVRPAEGELPFRSERNFQARVVLRNRDSVLTEMSPQAFVEAHGFRLLAEEAIATNPALAFRVETFAPSEGFRPSKPFGRAWCGAMRTATSKASCC
jgi:hypothetical protein